MRLACPATTIVLLALALPACTGGDDAEGQDGPDPTPADTEGDPTQGDPTQGDPTEGDTDGETDGDTDGDTDGEPEDPLAACRELPAAAGWIEGEAPVSTAEASAARIAAAGEKTWPLALRLMQVVSMDEMRSVAASPASMYAAMGLGYARWQNQQCGERIAEVMDFPETGDDIHATLGASIRELESRALPPEDDADPVVLSLRQSTWVFDETELPPPTPLLELYGAVSNAMEERGEPARELINCVIEAQSRGLLPDFLPEGQPAADTTSYDMNVSYLKAPWAGAMSETMVEFHYEDGSTAQLDAFGTELADVQLYEGEAFTSVELGLRGGELAMMAVIPADPAVGIAAFADTITAEDLATAREQAHYAIVDLTVPKVKVDSRTLDYNAGRLEFQCEEFTLRSVFHGAAVEMDEKGIKAAAATVVEGFQDGAPSPETTIEIDRSFLFFVYDRATQFVLYSGRFAPDQGG